MRLLRIALGTLLGLLLLVLAIALVYVFKTPECSNTIYETILSPNQQHKAILYARDCGATTGYATHISIAKPNEDIDNGSLIFTADADHGKVLHHPKHHELVDIHIIWVNDSLLELTYDKSVKIFISEAQAEGINTIHHKQ